MMRSSVVLPEPDGPSSASSVAVRHLEADASSAAKVPNFLETFLIEMLMT